jgi:ERCC4-related helicase
MSAVPAAELPNHFAPGSLVRARGREWIVLPGGSLDELHLRPLSGSEEDATVLSPALEFEPVEPATFPPPDGRLRASQETALLLRDALLMSLRRGAGPFRSFGNLAFEPRTYQLVPLLMALKLDTLRLLIADDVGIGKTIEAGMIARELLDRGELKRFAVLCPPHLVEQWVRELDDRFHIKAVAVTAGSAARLERDVGTVSESIFTVYPFTVVSLDFIKSDKRRGEFSSRCPELVIVDEAHTCAGTGVGRHQRYDLLRLLSADANRHMLFLTATPHSGDEHSFHNLLGLLKPEFLQLQTLTGNARDRLREKLANHFVQRQRVDIDEWHDSGIFPRRETANRPYTLSGQWESFFEAVLDYCSAVVERAGEDERRQRLNFWGTLALMRCVASSPAAAVQALRTRMSTQLTGEEEDELRERVFDGSEENLPQDDGELPAQTDDPALAQLVIQAERLLGQKGDPKLVALTAHLDELLHDGFAPVVFCRYIATAHYLFEQLKNRFPGATVDVITGELTPDERKQRIDELAQVDRALLIATDCLSEGINLQHVFNAVVHYDLSWNPTRHEQREGRVDRFGQEGVMRNGKRTVRAILMWGNNNPVDAVVLEVILKKARKIREELGVPVPLPDDDHTLTNALLQAVLLRRHEIRSRREDATRQGVLALDFAEVPQIKAMEKAWVDAADKAKKNRTVFAQNKLRPSDVLPEWQKMQGALGQTDDVRRFVNRALSRLGAGLEERGRSYRVPLTPLPEVLRERLLAENLQGTLKISFTQPPAIGARFVHRSHPLVGILADGLLETSLNTASVKVGAGETANYAANDAAEGAGERATTDPALLGRTGCWTTQAVQRLSTVLLLRLRHQLITQGAEPLLVEEATAIALVAADGGQRIELLKGDEPLDWLAAPTAEELADKLRTEQVATALAQLPEWNGQLESFAQERAQALLADHERVREASGVRTVRGRATVRALLPVDVIGVFVLLPALGF